MGRCREISKLVSESMDRRLPAGERFHVWAHLLICVFCRGFNHQLRLLRLAIRKDPERLMMAHNPSENGLSREAANRMKATLRRYSEGGAD
ncbi:MAG: hypothetical protein R6U98_02665 [Pirellulaceae bacterium]